MQRLLSTAGWDPELVRDDLRAYVVEHLGDVGAVLVVDETGFLKKGTTSVGVQRQYSGTAGKVDNCQLGVFLAYASAKGRAMIDRQLYLPERWADDPARCRAARVPEQVGSGPSRSWPSSCWNVPWPATWMTADEVYGGSPTLRGWLEGRGVSYVLAVKCIQLLEASSPHGVVRERAEQLAAPATNEMARWLLVRCRRRDGELAFSACWAGRHAACWLVQVAGTRWAVEEGFEQAKGEVGLDHYEVCKWPAWYRHITLALLAYAFLAVTRAQAASPERTKGDTAA